MSGLGYGSAVANTYAANFGDVVKHAVLCEVVVRERPPRYLESHGGRLVYDLSGLEPGPGGVWDFLEVASDHDDLNGSTYAELLRREAGTRHDPGNIRVRSHWPPHCFPLSRTSWRASSSRQARRNWPRVWL